MTLEVLSRPLQLSALAKLATDGSQPLWYDRPPRGEEWRARVTQIAKEFAHRDWLRALSPAIEATGRAAERLETVAGGRGVVVTTGQQPGLFGGPMYTWTKALSALAMADELQQRTGIPAAPVFWAATDDSDFAEASYTVVAGPHGAETIRLPEREGRSPMANTPLGDIAPQLDALARASGSAPGASVLGIVRESYAAGETIGGAYVRLLRRILEPLGICVLDASHPVVTIQGATVLRKALGRAAEVEAALAARTKEMKTAGHRAQVSDVPGRSLVFEHRGEGEKGGRERVSVSSASKVAEKKDARLSPNVLLRPVMERSILPTVVYMAGPAELTYFAQVSAVADALELPRPLALPRWSGTVIEPHVRRVLDRIGAQPDDFADPYALETRIAREELPASLQSALQQARADAAAMTARIADADKSEQMLPPAVAEGATRQLLHKLERLERRYVAAVKRRGSELLRDVAGARASLYPNGVPQERALNGIPFMAKYGDELFAKMLNEARAHAAKL